MMSKLENISNFILSKLMLKFVAISICCFIVFNCIFSSLIMNISSQDLSKISSIQKDVFSAIFFVSNAIEKINFSLTQKVVPIQNQTQEGSKDQKKETPYNYNIFIVNNTQDNDETLKQVASSSNPILCAQNDAILSNNYVGFILFNCFAYILVLMIMMFFSTIKKVYEDINNNKIYILKNPLVV